MSRKICPYCGRIVATDHVCDKKPKDTRRKQINTDSRWPKIRAEVKERDLVCKMCWSRGIYSPIDECHHIIPRDVKSEDEYVFNADNVIGLCHDCHAMIHREGWQKYVKLLQQLISKKNNTGYNYTR